MFKKCTAEDNELIMEYLLEEKAMNLFFIGDIEVFGYDSDFQDIYAQYDKEGHIEGVLLRYQNTYIPYSKKDIDLSQFVKIISEDPKLLMISGKEEIINRFQRILPLGKEKLMYFSELKEGTTLPDNSYDYEVKKATIEDVDRIFALKEKIEEFDIQPSSKDSMRRSFKTNSGRTHILEVDGEVVSCASTTAENTYSAMVVGVCTHPSIRQKGYASVVMTQLCNELLSEGKSLCLFYDNPKAGKIYKRLGFQDIGMWKMVYAKK